MEQGQAEATNCRVKDEGDDVMEWVVDVEYRKYSASVLCSKMSSVGFGGVVQKCILGWCRH